MIHKDTFFTPKMVPGGKEALAYSDIKILHPKHFDNTVNHEQRGMLINEPNVYDKFDKTMIKKMEDMFKQISI